MTTYTLTGDAIYSDLVTQDAVAVAEGGVTFEIVVPDQETGFSYTVNPFSPGTIEFGEAIINLETYGLRVNGKTIDFFRSAVVPSFVEIDWSQSGANRNTTLLDLSVGRVAVEGLGNVAAEYVFELAGAALPALNSLADLVLLRVAITDTTNPDGVFAPRQEIALSRLGGTVSENDRIIGTQTADTYNSGRGNDTILGRGGNDRLFGGRGNDLIDGGAGSDRIEGGAGLDTLSYGQAKAGVTVDLGNLSANTGDAAGDQINGIEFLIGSDFDDVLRDNNTLRRIKGEGGNDLLIGRAGDDTLVGGKGNDTLNGGTGADQLTGGSGRDTASYSKAGAGVVVDMVKRSVNIGEAAGDTFNSIENLIGSRHVDALLGNGKSNTLMGGDSGDLLDGRGGSDRLLGGDGNDEILGRSGRDRLEGSSGRDSLDGGAGNDTMTGGTGSDTFIFNGGRDRITDFESRDALRLDKSLWTGNLNKAGILALASVEGTDTVFRFGDGNVLTLDDWTDIAGLESLLTQF